MRLDFDSWHSWGLMLLWSTGMFLLLFGIMVWMASGPSAPMVEP